MPLEIFHSCLISSVAQMKSRNIFLLLGAFTKDQVYLKGALEILKNRKKINFHALLRLGKVSYRDVDRLMGAANFHNTRIPRFMRDLDHYHKKLDEIIVKNGLTEADLEHV